MNARQLEVFHAIMSSSSLTQAARMLNVSQPAISAFLKHTEDQTGVRLFHRISGRLVPTPEAEQLFPEVDRIIGQLGILDRVTQDLRSGKTGFLSVIGNTTLINVLLPDLVSKFHASRPGVRLRLETAYSRQIFDRVARREFDLGLVYGSGQDVQIGTKLLGHLQLVCAMRRDHPLAKLKKIGLKNLIGQKVVTYGPKTPLRPNIEDVMTRLDATMEVSLPNTACLLARSGPYVALIDSLIFQGTEYSDLVVRPFAPLKRIEVNLVTPKDRPRSKLSLDFEAELARHLAERFKKGPGRLAMTV
ncbi:LysR family transcriptional regulator [Bradyrhizobium sp. LHD-71]|uniref:LysR family transcriptional regulator n=1 Tax=Bradyrhizobium sp. LHD-71 TaxID=3072141 RepID=UPI0028107291|nr:LysR family transcriptional regulator [Bradyrhizobium sp. LHD-71]MDQ8727984.1 LysR family transcriptional regulator [Bradyrhizobium sp. LHD-71]